MFRVLATVSFFPYTTLFRSRRVAARRASRGREAVLVDDAPLVWSAPESFTLVGVEPTRSEEHTSELQSPCNIVCRLLLEKKKHIRCNGIYARTRVVLHILLS